MARVGTPSAAAMWVRPVSGPTKSVARSITAAALIERATLFVGPDTGLTHIAAALGVPTLAIHLGHPPEVCAALGDNVALVRQVEPYADPALTTPEQVLAALDRHLAVSA